MIHVASIKVILIKSIAVVHFDIIIIVATTMIISKCTTVILFVIVIVRGQGFMAVNRPESEGVARGQGRFTLP